MRDESGQCRGFGERSFTIVREDGDYRIVSMTGFGPMGCINRLVRFWIALAVCCVFGGWTAMIRADESPLSPYLWKNRVVVVFVDCHDSPIARRQQQMLSESRGGLIERDMVVVSVVGDRVQVDGRLTDRIEAGDLRHAVDASSTEFGVLLIGKDGGVKLQSDEPVAAERLFALIDTMPMRQQEMLGQSDRIR